MLILQTRFANTRKNKGEDSGPKVMVMVDDDESDEGDAAETEIGVCEQESDGLDKDLDEDQYYNRNEGTYMGRGTHSEEPNNPDTPPGFASDHVQCVNVEQVVPILESTAVLSPEIGLDPPAAVTDTTQAASKVESISQGAVHVLPTPPLETSNATVVTALHLPVAQPSAPPSPGTSDMAADTPSRLPAALPLTPSCLGISDTAAGTSSQLPTALSLTPSCLGISDIAAGTPSQLPAALPLTPCLGISDTATGTSSQLPAALPRGRAIDDSHKDGDASIYVGHLSEKNMSWQD